MDSHEPRRVQSEPETPEEYPGPFSERGTRILKFAVVFMGILLIVGFMVVVITIAYKAVKLGQKTDPPAAVVSTQDGFPQLDLSVAPGTTIGRVELDGDRMAVHVTGGPADEILIIDIKSGQLVGRVKLQERLQ